jgi:hypothetical protein
MADCVLLSWDRLSKNVGSISQQSNDPLSTIISQARSDSIGNVGLLLLVLPEELSSELQPVARNSEGKRVLSFSMANSSSFPSSYPATSRSPSSILSIPNRITHPEKAHFNISVLLIGYRNCTRLSAVTNASDHRTFWGRQLHE